MVCFLQKRSRTAQRGQRSRTEVHPRRPAAPGRHRRQADNALVRPAALPQRLAMCLGFFFINYNSYFFITWLPTYLVKERGMDLISMGFVAALPLLIAMLVEIFAGWLSDRIYRQGRWSLTRIRKSFLVVGLLMASCIGFAAFAESSWLAIVLLCIAKSGTTVAATQVWALPAMSRHGHDLDAGRPAEYRVEHGRRGRSDHHRVYRRRHGVLHSRPAVFRRIDCRGHSQLSVSAG
ncbi:MFS transporter [Pseudomonas sp. PCH446]